MMLLDGLDNPVTLCLKKPSTKIEERVCRGEGKGGGKECGIKSVSKPVPARESRGCPRSVWSLVRRKELGEGRWKLKRTFQEHSSVNSDMPLLLLCNEICPSFRGIVLCKRMAI
jgi:hypothetical protein